MSAGSVVLVALTAFVLLAPILMVAFLLSAPSRRLTARTTRRP